MGSVTFSPLGPPLIDQRPQSGAEPAQPLPNVTPEARAESLSYWRAFHTVHGILYAPFAVIIIGVVLYGAVVEPLIRYIVGSTVLLMILITWAWRRHGKRPAAQDTSKTPALHP